MSVCFSVNMCMKTGTEDRMAELNLMNIFLTN